jgi:ubiquitin-protein ligase
MQDRIIKREKRSLDHFACPNTGATLRVVDERGLVWDAYIITDDDSLLGVQRFDLVIILPPNYPFSPMKVRFLTPIKHCLVTSNGRLNLDILGSQWSPSCTIGAILVSVLSLVNDCDIDYMKSRQIARTSLFRQELIERVWAENFEQLT